ASSRAFFAEGRALYAPSGPAVLARVCAVHGERELLELQRQHVESRAGGVVFRPLAGGAPRFARAGGVGEAHSEAGDGAVDGHAPVAAISASSCASLACARRCFSRIASP